MPDQPESSEINQEAARVLERLARSVSGQSNECPICGQPFTSRRPSGRCVILAPCGHRYQGKLPKQSKEGRP